MISHELVFPSLGTPSCQVNLVVGPPGGGKSHHVATHKALEDIVIDLDDIAAKLAGVPIYTEDRAVWLQRALWVRNEQLRALAREAPNQVAWVVVCAPGEAFGWWKKTLRPRAVIRLVPTPLQCELNIRRDARRTHDLERHLALSLEWFEKNAAAWRRASARAARRRASASADDWDL